MMSEKQGEDTMPNDTVLSDREVGELWQKLTVLNDHMAELGYGQNCRQLIRKLVEERARRAAIATGNTEPFIKKALRDFGIDPQTWEK